jgi:hypothetical protein
MAAGVSPNVHVHHQDPLRIESQLQNTQKGVGSLTSERGVMGGGGMIKLNLTYNLL